MIDRVRRPLAALLALSLLAQAPLPALAAGARYDVSYLWHGNLESVYVYRDKIARVLGPSVAKRLKIVRGEKNYGLIYHRRGSGAGANKVVRRHTKLLKRQGLEAAAPIRSRDWTFVSRSGREVAPPPAQVAKAARERKEELKDIEAVVEDYIKKLRRRGHIASDERTAWSVYDFTTGEKLVDINEDMQLQGASLVKPFFCLAFFHQVKRGKLSYGPKSRRHMERAIQSSSNRSTNWIIRHVGGPSAVNRILKRHYGHIFEDTRIVEYIPAGGRTYRNKASVHDYSRFLFALWKESIPGAKEIKRVMSLPGRDRLYTGARDVPKGTKVYNKTGSTARLCGDMGILNIKGKDGKEYPYTLIGVIDKRRPASNYTSWIRRRGDVIRNVSNIVYRAVSQLHDTSDEEADKSKDDEAPAQEETPEAAAAPPRKDTQRKPEPETAAPARTPEEEAAPAQPAPPAEGWRETFIETWREKGRKMARTRPWLEGRRVLVLGEAGGEVMQKTYDAARELLADVGASTFQAGRAGGHFPFSDCVKNGVLESACLREAVRELREEGGEAAGAILIIVTKAAIDRLPEKLPSGSTVGPPAGIASHPDGWTLISEFWRIRNKGKSGTGPDESLFFEAGRRHTVRHELLHILGLPHHQNLENPGFPEAKKCSDCEHGGARHASSPHDECAMYCGSADDEWFHSRKFGKGFDFCGKCMTAARAVVEGIEAGP